ncbi:MAG: T9SS type A sorting domain-containing protein [Bacteroidales bacterium]|nr:T9SS type A sorting domain-containing protein [Bacteroidales bacterium]
MKKVYLFLSLMMSVLALNAQVFTLQHLDNETGDEVEFQNELNITLEDEAGVAIDFIYFVNNTNEDVAFRIQKNIQQISEGNSLMMCFGETCLDANISEIQTVAAGEIFTHFDLMYLYADKSVTRAEFTILGEDGQAIQSFTVKYNDNVALPSVEKQVPLALSAAPIPANNTTTISYSIPSKYASAKVVIRNTVGSVVKTMNVATGKSGKLPVNVSDLNSGVYFYSVIADGQTLSTKKLVVKH